MYILGATSHGYIHLHACVSFMGAKTAGNLAASLTKQKLRACMLAIAKDCLFVPNSVMQLLSNSTTSTPGLIAQISNC